jgi:hypothetical protein
MTHASCPGYAKAPYKSLVADYPGDEAYDPKHFRTEWGPIFHRGRLDGSARVLVIGQDPAAHETIARRILVGEAGQRLQGFLARLGIDRSYVLVNTYLYSVYGSATAVNAAGIKTYRERWLDAIVAKNHIEAVVTLGGLAEKAYDAWPASASATWAHANMTHPTFPESASASGTMTKKAAMKKLTDSWNAALTTLSASPLTPDTARPLVTYGAELTKADDVAIPEEDLPAGLPAWMRSVDAWARRTGTTTAEKRAQISVTIPKNARPA